MARPIPLAAPVTSTTLSVTLRGKPTKRKLVPGVRAFAAATRWVAVPDGQVRRIVHHGKLCTGVERGRLPRDPSTLHPQVEKALNDGDVEAARSSASSGRWW
jgi:hypothetical protein